MGWLRKQKKKFSSNFAIVHQIDNFLSYIAIFSGLNVQPRPSRRFLCKMVGICHRLDGKIKIQAQQVIIFLNLTLAGERRGWWPGSSSAGARSSRRIPDSGSSGPPGT